MTLYLLVYLALAIFGVAAGARVYKQLTMPAHLRWELYPVKTEPGEKAQYGGSYLEETDWWKKKRHHSLWNEVTYMAPEIILLRGLWEENRRLWWVSFPFHFGLYILIATVGLLVLGALGMAFGGTIGPEAGFFGMLIYYFTIIFAFIGLTLGTIGSIGLFIRRVTDPTLKPFNTFPEYFNLIGFIAFFVVALAAWLLFDHNLVGARMFTYGLITVGGGKLLAGFTPVAGILGSLTIVLAAFLTAYIPLTHMSHMFMKYFMYHSIRWEDEPNLRGSKLEARILSQLGFKPTWAAAHLGADGNKTWADVATSAPEVKK